MARAQARARDTEIVRTLINRAGRTYADEAGITLKNTPAPLFRLLVLTSLLSARISADIAVAAARELFAAGYRTPEKMAESTWQDRVDALGRGHYVRYDESTATQLGETAQAVLDDYRGDLRLLGESAEHRPSAAADLIRRFPGIGPVGADIFLREVQDVWDWVAPYFDERALSTADELGLPKDPFALADLADGAPAALAAALVRASLDDELRADFMGRTAGTVEST
ncbi:hypothetical protein [Gordonia soli]|uniref:Endonuclease n=1 Tax=Gordonia soli NBRC 108243 TaxID=1223545 RepID=M0QGG1_9ACTN|nr:hypothetical protein [Gordonia soli]GAC66487.1 hypothetical protein GS4_02_01980 [Gordonia soli NBRC 108243]